MHRNSCPLHQMQPSRRCRSIGRAIYSVLPIVVTLMLLPTTAFATPPDSWWIAGIYDGGDGDDIVTLVYETSGSNAAALSHVPPLRSLTEASFASIVHRGPSCQSTGSPRSPPRVAFSCLFNCSPDDTPSTLSFLGPLPRHASRSPVCPDWVTSLKGREDELAAGASAPPFPVLRERRAGLGGTQPEIQTQARNAYRVLPERHAEECRPAVEPHQPARRDVLKPAASLAAHLCGSGSSRLVGGVSECGNLTSGGRRATRGGDRRVLCQAGATPGGD